MVEKKINELKYFVNFIFKEFIKIKYELLDIVDRLSIIEVLMSFSKVSKENNWIRPTISEQNTTLKAKQFRHPLIKGDVVSNDIEFSNNNIMLITEPNMGGKSTLTRSIALLIVLNQIGCNVPCEYLEISLFDKLFIRIGINDKLKQNKSTFLIEMEDVNYLIKNGTENSFFLF